MIGSYSSVENVCRRDDRSSGRDFRSLLYCWIRCRATRSSISEARQRTRSTFTVGGPGDNGIVAGCEASLRFFSVGTGKNRKPFFLRWKPVFCCLGQVRRAKSHDVWLLDGVKWKLCGRRSVRCRRFIAGKVCQERHLMVWEISRTRRSVLSLVRRQVSLFVGFRVFVSKSPNSWRRKGRGTIPEFSEGGLACCLWSWIPTPHSCPAAWLPVREVSRGLTDGRRLASDAEKALCFIVCCCSAWWERLCRSKRARDGAAVTAAPRTGLCRGLAKKSLVACMWNASGNSGLRFVPGACLPSLWRAKGRSCRIVSFEERVVHHRRNAAADVSTHARELDTLLAWYFSSFRLSRLSPCSLVAVADRLSCQLRHLCSDRLVVSYCRRMKRDWQHVTSGQRFLRNWHCGRALTCGVTFYRLV